MAKKLTYPSTRKTTLGARLRVAMLPFNVRIPERYTITVIQQFNSNNNPEQISLKSNLEVTLSAETKLNFNGIIIEIAEETIVNRSGLDVSIIDQPNNVIIPINSTTITEGLILVAGCKNFNCTPEIQTTDTTNVSHGVEKEEKQTFNSKKLSIDVVEIYGDTGGKVLLDMCENLKNRNFEFYFNYSYPDGSFKQGAALITSPSITSGLQTLKSFRIDARVQPGTYQYLNV